MFFAWVLFGAVVGVLAAIVRGFSPIVGVVAGAFLGLLSPLLFGVTGVATRGDLATKRCSECAETVKKEAKVCKHCGARFDGQATPLA